MAAGARSAAEGGIKMLMTSAEAAKELKKLNDQHDALIKKEGKSSVFTAAIQENVEDVRPSYDFKNTQEELAQLEEKIRRIKHAINGFNLTQEVPEFGMTIDQMLIYIPQLSARKKKLDRMRSRLPMERCERGAFSRSSSVVEYDYSNYEVKQAEEEYMQVSDELARAQNALDIVNSTITFEVEV